MKESKENVKKSEGKRRECKRNVKVNENKLWIKVIDEGKLREYEERWSKAKEMCRRANKM